MLRFALNQKRVRESRGDCVRLFDCLRGKDADCLQQLHDHAIDKRAMCLHIKLEISLAEFGHRLDERVAQNVVKIGNSFESFRQFLAGRPRRLRDVG